MPCYEIRTVQVEFNAGNEQYLLKALKEANISHTFNDTTKIIYGNNWEINLEEQTASVRQGYEGELNKVRRAYSETVVNEVARKKKWLVKKVQGNKIQLKKY